MDIPSDKSSKQVRFVGTLNAEAGIQSAAGATVERCCVDLKVVLTANDVMQGAEGGASSAVYAETNHLHIPVKISSIRYWHGDQHHVQGHVSFDVCCIWLLCCQTLNCIKPLCMEPECTLLGQHVGGYDSTSAKGELAAVASPTLPKILVNSKCPTAINHVASSLHCKSAIIDVLQICSCIATSSTSCLAY